MVIRESANTHRNAQAARVHLALWDTDTEAVDYDGKMYRIRRVNDSKRNFAIVDFDAGTRYVTQNLRKPSAWTRWVNSDESHKLTWVFSAGSYSARIQSDAYELRVFLLNPDQLVFQCPPKREVIENVYPIRSDIV